MAFSLSAQAQTNLVANPDFEDGHAKWALWSDAAIVKEDALAGFYSLRIGPGPGGADQVLEFIPVIGALYVLDAAIRFTEAQEIGALFIECLDATGKSISKNSVPLSSAMTIPVSISIMVLAGTKKLRIWAWKDLGPGYLFVDNIRVLKQ